MLFQRREELSAVFHKEAVWLDHSKADITLKELAEMPLSVSAGCCDLLKKCCAEASLSPQILSINTTRNTTLQWAYERTAVAVVPIEPGEFLGPDLVTKKYLIPTLIFLKPLSRLKTVHYRLLLKSF